MVGKTSLLEAYAVIESCDLFLNSDSGLAVAAMALGIPTATIWGPVDPLEFGPAWQVERHLAVRREIACSPCARFGMAKEGRGVLNYRVCGHHDCLRRLDVDAVFRALRDKYARLLEGG